MKRFLSVLLLGTLIFSLTACQSNDYVAKVDDVVITKEKLDTMVEQVAADQGMNINDPEMATQKEALELQILYQLINEQLLLKEAKKRNLEADPELVKSQLEQLKAQFKSDEEFKTAYKEKYDMSEEEVIKNIEEYIIKDKVIEEITKDVKVTTDLKTYYEENTEQFLQPEQVKARHILVKEEEEAKDIIKQLKEDNADMGELAVEKSTEEAAQQSQGDLGYFPRGTMVPEFEEAAFALEIGQITSEPVKTEYGYHVIKVEDKTPEKQLPFEEVEDLIEERLLNEAKSDKLREFIENAREEAEIENKLEDEFNKKMEEENEKEDLPEEEKTEDK